MKQREVIDEFLDAVKRRDSDKIHEMANAVEFLKAHEGFYDQTRAAIVVLKGMVENLDVRHVSREATEVAVSFKLITASSAVQLLSSVPSKP